MEKTKILVICASPRKKASLYVAEQAAKAAAAKEYAARKGIVEDEDDAGSCMSGIPSRPYCKGRNYDPNRYASNSTEE